MTELREDLVLMCEEMTVETGVDLHALIECARMAEEIVGHPEDAAERQAAFIEKRAPVWPGR